MTTRSFLTYTGCLPNASSLLTPNALILSRLTPCPSAEFGYPKVSVELPIVARWLQGSSTGVCGDNNWVLFQVLIAEFLAGAGFEHHPAQITA